MRWPADLQALTFGENFDQSLDNVRLPAGLQSLTLGDGFNEMAGRPSNFDFW